jgi:hypothetical protein
MVRQLRRRPAGRRRAALSGGAQAGAGEEGVLEELFKGQTLDRVPLKEAGDERTAGPREARCDVLRQLRVSSLNVAQQVDVVGAVEGRAAGQELEKDGADAPEVGLQCAWRGGGGGLRARVEPRQQLGTG